MKDNYITIFDTTLRDGEQSPGASMNTEEKIKIALQLQKLGVDVIEAGFAASSPGDLDAIHRIAEVVDKSVICSLARAKEGDIDAAAKAIAPAKKKRIHTFIATSPIHMEHKLRMKPDEVIKNAVNAVQYARTFADDVEFSCEDATRSDIEFLKEILAAVIEAGATTLNIPDTVGYAVPHDMASRIEALKEVVADRAVMSVHCHNDLGLGVANSLAAVVAGARQVECTINGLGERAGNASLEEIVMTMRTRHDAYPFETGINTKEIYPASRLVSTITGIIPQPNKAIVGKNAFAHEAGIHQDGVLKNAMTYEIMRPEDVGLQKNSLVLGKHSGRHAVVTRLKELGYELKEDEIARFFSYFKDLADKKKEVFDEDLLALVGEAIFKEEEQRRYKVTDVQISTGMHSPPMTMVTLRDHQDDKKERFEVAHGNGGVDAGVLAVKKILGTDATIKSFNLVAITGGSDALSEVSVTVVETVDGKEYKAFGTGVSVDVSVAGIFSFVDAINKIEYMKKMGNRESMNGV